MCKERGNGRSELWRDGKEDVWGHRRYTSARRSEARQSAVSGRVISCSRGQEQAARGRSPESRYDLRDLRSGYAERAQRPLKAAARKNRTHTRAEFYRFFSINLSLLHCCGKQFLATYLKNVGDAAHVIKLEGVRLAALSYSVSRNLATAGSMSGLWMPSVDVAVLVVVMPEPTLSHRSSNSTTCRLTSPLVYPVLLS